MTVPIDPNDPNAGSGGNRRFTTGNPRGGPIGDPSDPTGNPLRGGYGRQLRATRLPNSPRPKKPKAPPRPKASRGATASHGGAHSAHRTATRSTHVSHLLVAGSAFGLQHDGQLFRVSGPDLLMQHLLEQTAIMKNAFGEITALSSFGSIIPIGHAPSANGRTNASATRAAANVGITARGLLQSYSSTNHSAVVRYAANHDSFTVDLPVAQSLTDAQMAAASIVEISIRSETNPTDARVIAVVG